MSKFSVLVVDDFEPFRRLVRIILQPEGKFRIVGEASDGLEAVQQITKLRPDLVLLDLGLPTLNGIEVARRLRALVPYTRILFVSAESRADIVQQALHVSDGYVLKLYAAEELVPAIEMVIRGKQYVTSELMPSMSVKVEKDHPSEEHFVSGRDFRHDVAFYRDEGAFVGGLTRFIETTINDGNVAILIGTDSHRNRIVEKLQGRGINLADAIQNRSFLSLDSIDALSLFMLSDWPDRIRFSDVVGDLMKAATKSANEQGRRVGACGELAPILWAQGLRSAAIQVERMWDEIARAYRVDTLCGYVSTTLDRDRHRHEFNSICAAHSAVYFR